MTSSQVQILGFVAGTLTTFAFLPQVLQTRRTGGKDLSWTMLTMFGSGVVLWLGYGFLVDAPPIIVANGLTIVQILAIVWIKARHAGPSLSRSAEEDQEPGGRKVPGLRGQADDEIEGVDAGVHV